MVISLRADITIGRVVTVSMEGEGSVKKCLLELNFAASLLASISYGLSVATSKLL
jgi:hypothetical protein